jgi:nitric oxide synthase-interacting protein
LVAQRKQIQSQSLEVSVESKEEREKRLEEERKVQEFVKEETLVLSTVKVEKIDQTSTAFWLPYMQPSAESQPSKSKSTPKCPGSDHPISIKKLTPVIFKKQENECICFICTKTLKNGMSISVIKPCGHVVCSSCLVKFTKNKCPVCEVKVKEVIELAVDGTGFAAAGKAQVVKDTVAFM